jgi:hypothetical protein
MITNNDLTTVYLKLQEDLEPLRQELKEAKAKFKSNAKQLEAPYLEMLEKYYDEKLIDINGVSVKIGNTVSNGKISYKVINRGMQFVFGEMMFNPRVICQKIRASGDTARYSKEKHIHPSELKEFTVIKQSTSEEG